LVLGFSAPHDYLSLAARLPQPCFSHDYLSLASLSSCLSPKA